MDKNRLSLLQGLDQEELEKIKNNAVQRQYSKGSIVFVEGQETDGIYFILSGLIKIVTINKDGREKILALLGEGEIMGEMTLFNESLRSASAEALENTIVYAISKSQFITLLQTVPTLAMGIIDVLSHRLRQANDQIRSLSFLNARSRVILNLLQLVAAQSGENSGEIRMRLSLTHAELAKLTGVSRETVTKIITELQEQGLLKVLRKQLWIENLDKLRQEVM